MSARLRFLGAPVAMHVGHLYRGRWAVPLAQSDVAPCAGAVDKVRALLLEGNQWDPFGTFTFPEALEVLDPAWPASRTFALPGGCTVYTQSVWKGEEGRLLDFASMQTPGPDGVQLFDFWDQTDGTVLAGPTPLCGPNQTFLPTKRECAAGKITPPVVIIPGAQATVIRTPSDDTTKTPNLFWLVAAGVGLGFIAKALA